MKIVAMQSLKRSDDEFATEGLMESNEVVMPGPLRMRNQAPDLLPMETMCDRFPQRICDGLDVIIQVGKLC